jgi:hypothetical protein
MERETKFADMWFIPLILWMYHVNLLQEIRRVYHIGSGPHFADHQTEGISGHVTCVCTRN